MRHGGNGDKASDFLYALFTMVSNVLSESELVIVDANALKSILQYSKPVILIVYMKRIEKSRTVKMSRKFWGTLRVRWIGDIASLILAYPINPR